jgi:RNA 3'-terminal phosphate cyclase (ATP)
MIELDGSMGEGGGQVLRTALSLSLLTGQPMTLSRVRAGRQRPGLRPQHLAALNGCARISDAAISGDRVGSQRVAFSPGTVRPDEYHLDIGTTSAATLVLQTLLLPLAIAPDASRLAIAGGTHVPWSPCFHYLDRH